MKKLLLLSASLAFISSAAIAKDLSTIQASVAAPSKSTTWTGVYFGLNAGATFGQTSFSATPGQNWWGDPDSPGVFSATNRNTPMGGATLGGQVGVNYQFANNIVIGLEADGDWLGATGNYKSGPFPGIDSGFYGADGNFSGNWLLTARGRIGYSITPDILLYGTGGLAVADYSYSHRAYFYNDPSTNPAYSLLNPNSRVASGQPIPSADFIKGDPAPDPFNPGFSEYHASGNITPTPADQVACLNPGNRPNGNCRGDGNGTGLYRLPFTKGLGGVNAIRQTLAKAGWTVGGGVEFKVTDNLSLKAEYLYTKFGSQNTNSYYVMPYGNLNVFQMQHKVGISNHNIVRAGVNYHVNWGGVPSVAF